MEQTAINQLRGVVEQTIQYLPHVIAGFTIAALGWLVAWIAKRILMRFIVVLRIHRMFEKSRWGAAMRKADVRYTLIEGAGNVLFVFVFLIFLESAIAAWQLDVLAQLLAGLIAFLPQLVIAAVILAIGLVAANYASRRVEEFLEEVDFGHAFFVAGLSKAGIIVFIVALTLDYLNIAPRIVLGSFLITAGSLGAALILSLGLGSQDAVRRFWEGVSRKEKGQKR